MSRFEPKQAQGRWWVRDVYMDQWTACETEREARALAERLETAFDGGYESIVRESLPWIAGDHRPASP